MASRTPKSSNHKLDKANNAAARKTATATPTKLDRMISLLSQENGFHGFLS